MSHTETAVSSQEENCTLLLGMGGAGGVSSKEIKHALENGDVAARADAMKHLIRLHMNGESQNHLIMTVIKYIVPVDDHLVKKLLLYFWEVIDKTDKDGNLLGVIILICSFLRNDLQHPNEYVRGITLRFLCKLNEKELIEPLISAVDQNLTHKIVYVRRNAVLAVKSIYSKFPELMPDAPEKVEEFIRNEDDVSARRNAFDMLAAFAPERAARFLSDFRDSNDLPEAGGCFLMSVVDFCRQMIRANPYDRAKYVPILFSVLQTKSAAVRYQCATTLLSLSSSPTAIRHATLTYIDILKTHTDNSVRLIVVEQLDSMRERFLDILRDSLLDVLSALADGTMEVRQRIVSLAVELLSSKNIDAFINAMKKELLRAQHDADLANSPQGQEYKLMVVKAISAALARHPRSAPQILPVLLDLISDSSTAGEEVAAVIKQVLHVAPAVRRTAVAKLMEYFPTIPSSSVLRAVLWMFGAHVEAKEDVLAVFGLLKEAIGPLPLAAPEVTGADGGDGVDGDTTGTATPAVQVVTSVREDGTYVTTYTTASAAATAVAAAAADGSSTLRAMIVKGDYFLAASLANTIAKLVIQLFVQHGGGAEGQEAQSDAIAILSDMLRFGTERGCAHPMDEDTQEHTRLMLSLLAHPRSGFLIDVAKMSKEAFGDLSRRQLQQSPLSAAGGSGGDGAAPQMCAIDAPIVFTQLLGSSGKEAVFGLEAADETAAAAVGGRRSSTAGAHATASAFLRRVEETMPLSGFSDPVYCEASIEVQQFEVAVDWLLVNRTSQQLDNLTIELASLGGMKLCERPQTYTLAPHSSLKARVSLKVSATVSGVIYGSVLYDAPNGERCSVILNDIHVDIMNYIHPAPCEQNEFRQKWNVNDWENKVDVSTSKHELREYVELLVKELNMQLLDDLPEAETLEDGASQYISCNLFARTVFGEDALVNVSAERDSEGLIIGVVRIRSNAQALAFGIGEKLGQLQKSGKF